MSNAAQRAPRTIADRDRSPCGVHQRLVEALDADGRKSVIGYRFVHSPTLGTIYTLRDITELERRRAEREVIEKLSQVGRACAMVAHEIGNPLAAIKATLQSIEAEAEAAGLGDPFSRSSARWTALTRSSESSWAS